MSTTQPTTADFASISVSIFDIDSVSFESPLIYAILTTPRGTCEVHEWLNSDDETVSRGADSHMLHHQLDKVAALFEPRDFWYRDEVLEPVHDALDAEYARYRAAAVRRG